MKKIFFTILMAVALLGSASASELIKTQRASIKEIEAVFDSEDESVAKDEWKNENQLPIQAKRTFTKMFDGYKIKQATHFAGKEGEGFYIAAENEKESIIVKIDEDLQISIFRQMKK